MEDPHSNIAHGQLFGKLKAQTCLFKEKTFESEQSVGNLNESLQAYFFRDKSAVSDENHLGFFLKLAQRHSVTLSSLTTVCMLPVSESMLSLAF